MGINETIYAEVMDYIYEYGAASHNYRNFLLEPQEFQNRQEKAIEIIEGIMTAHGKQALLSHVAQLAKVEQGNRVS